MYDAARQKTSPKGRRRILGIHLLTDCKSDPILPLRAK